MGKMPVGSNDHFTTFSKPVFCTVVWIYFVFFLWPLYLHPYDQPSSFIQAWDECIGLCTPKAEFRIVRQLCCYSIDSFHVGSGCYDAMAYSAAVASARTVFNLAAAQGFNFTLLDIGGGFPGQKNPKLPFEEVCPIRITLCNEPESEGSEFKDFFYRDLCRYNNN